MALDFFLGLATSPVGKRTRKDERQPVEFVAALLFNGFGRDTCLTKLPDHSPVLLAVEKVADLPSHDLADLVYLP